MAKEAIAKQCNIIDRNDLVNKLSTAIINGGKYSWREVTGTETVDTGYRTYEQDVYTNFQESIDSILARFASELPKLEQEYRDRLFHEAIRANNKEFVQKFLEFGADVNSIGPDGSTALHYYVLEHNLFGHDETAMITKLLDQNARPNIKNADGVTALSVCRSPEVIKLLISHGAVVINEQGNATILHTLVQENNLSLVKFFVPIVDLNQQNEEGKTAFDLAIEGNQVSFAKILADNGAKCSFETLEGIIAAGHVAMFRIAYSTIEDNNEINTRLAELVEEGHHGMQVMLSDAYHALEAKHDMAKAEAHSVANVVSDAAGAGGIIRADGTLEIAGAGPHRVLAGEGTEGGHGDDFAG